MTQLDNRFRKNTKKILLVFY